MEAFPHLLAPVRLGPVELASRVVSTSHQTTLVHDHVPTDDLVAYHVARARGGAGAVWLEATAVHPTGLLTAHTIAGYLPAIVPAYRTLGDAVRAHGSRLFVQLFHGGREQISSAPRAPAVAPSAVPTLRYKVEPRALSLAEIRDLLEHVEVAARRVREGGVDGVELSAAHGYLAAQFMALRSNRRDDGYGGALDARLRFAREALEAIRRGAGDGVAVGVRLSSDERSADGLDGAACAAIAGALAADGLVDFVSATIGDSATYQGSVQIVPPPPEPANAIVDPVTALRAALPAGLPLVATTRIVDLADAERVLASGVCDVVGMTRALIADPDLVRKARAGRAADVVPCIGCNQGCIGHYHAEIPIACLANLRTGRERRLPARGAGAEPAVDTLVIGAGPAGLTAAIEAASAGSRVVLVERGDGVGGQLRLAGRCPAHAELWVRYRALVERDLARTGVELRLGTVADAALADGFARVVLATGARPYMPPLPPLPGMRVVQAWDAILDPSAVPADGLALVLDWGGDWSGLDAAEALAVRGRRVALASASPVAGETLHQYQRAAYLARLDRRDVALLPHRELAVDGDGVVLRNIYSGRLAPLPEGTTTLVLAQGRVPDDDLWPALEGRPGVIRVGDVLGPRSMEEAVLEGGAAVLAAAR